MIYAIRAKGTEFYKIGYCSDLLGQLDRRVETMQTGCPLDLEIVQTCAGGMGAERYIHNILIKAGCHHRGEWFKDSKVTQDVIRWMAEGKFNYQTKGSVIPLRQAIKHKRLGAILNWQPERNQQGNLKESATQ